MTPRPGRWSSIHWPDPPARGQSVDKRANSARGPAQVVDNPVAPCLSRRILWVLPEGADEPATDPQVLAQAGTRRNRRCLHRRGRNGAAVACSSGIDAGENVPSGVLLSLTLTVPQPDRVGEGPWARPSGQRHLEDNLAPGQDRGVRQCRRQVAADPVGDRLEGSLMRGADGQQLDAAAVSVVVLLPVVILERSCASHPRGR